MDVLGVTPILNVSSLDASIAWFGRLGWSRKWVWGDPPDFGAVANGSAEIFLCQGWQGHRGRASPEHGWDHVDGGWMTWWLATPADVDRVWALALERDVLVTVPPSDMPWGVRECHLRHPDGHTFRVSAPLPEE